MQTPKASKGSPKDSPQKVSARPTRQLKINPVGQRSTSSSTNTTARTPKDISPKVAERRSPRSPLPEKRRPSKLSELESQISKLQDDLKNVKDKLIATESSKREAQADAEEVKKQLADVSVKLEESQKQVSELVASKEASVLVLENISREKDQEWECQIESAHKQQSADSAALAYAQDEIRRLKLQLEMVAESQDEQEKQRESTKVELKSLKENLAEALSLVQSMKHELKGSQESEAQAQELVRETLLQLEAAKGTVNSLRSDVSRSTEAYNAIVSELEQSKARVIFLEDLVSKLNADRKEHSCPDPIGNQKFGQGVLRTSEILDVDELESELQRTRFEVIQLKSALEAAEIRYNEERSHSSKQIKNASEHLEQIKAQSSQREAQLEADLKNAKANIEELKANLMDKETELQGISEENESLNMKLERSKSCQREQELENELKKLRNHAEAMKSNLTDKMRELQNMAQENGKLKQEIEKREKGKGVENEHISAEVEASRAAEQDAMAKLACLMEEVDKSNKKAARAAEQLEAAQAANAEMEAELRKLKVQSDQWRKAAEAAASMLSPGSNGKYVERTGSLPLDNNYSPIGGRISSPYLDEYDEDAFKKRNGSVLKKIGVLWKKPQK